MIAKIDLILAEAENSLSGQDRGVLSQNHDNGHNSVWWILENCEEGLLFNPWSLHVPPSQAMPGVVEISSINLLSVITFLKLSSLPNMEKSLEKFRLFYILEMCRSTFGCHNDGQIFLVFMSGIQDQGC